MNNEEFEDIKKFILMMLSHLRHDGDFSNFNFEEQRELIKIEARLLRGDKE